MYIKRNKTTVFPFTTYIYIYIYILHVISSFNISKANGKRKGKKKKERDRQTDRQTEGTAKTSHHCGLMKMEGNENGLKPFGTEICGGGVF